MISVESMKIIDHEKFDKKVNQIYDRLLKFSIKGKEKVKKQNEHL